MIVIEEATCVESTREMEPTDIYIDRDILRYRQRHGEKEGGGERGGFIIGIGSYDYRG